MGFFEGAQPRPSCGRGSLTPFAPSCLPTSHSRTGVWSYPLGVGGHLHARKEGSFSMNAVVADQALSLHLDWEWEDGMREKS